MFNNDVKYCLEAITNLSNNAVLDTFLYSKNLFH